MDLVTAVITTHKRKPELVERALKSILAQTYPNMEVIVVDDSPRDYEYRNLVKETVGRYGVQYIAHDTCQGACVARNTGLEAARGTFVAFLDDDDEWMPEKIEKQIACFSSQDIALVYCGSNVLDEKTGTQYNWPLELNSGKIYDSLILGNYIGSTSFPLLRTEALRSIGGFDPLMQSAQDYDVWLRLAQKYEVSYIDEPLATYHVHEGEQITRNYVKKINGLERLNAKNAEYLMRNRKARWIREIKIAPMYAGNRQIDKALVKWAQAAVMCPEQVKENARYLFQLVKLYLLNIKRYVK